jgi:hypothetical protein
MLTRTFAANPAVSLQPSDPLSMIAAFPLCADRWPHKIPMRVRKKKPGDTQVRLRGSNGVAADLLDR